MVDICLGSLVRSCNNEPAVQLWTQVFVNDEMLWVHACFLERDDVALVVALCETCSNIMVDALLVTSRGYVGWASPNRLVLA